MDPEPAARYWHASRRRQVGFLPPARLETRGGAPSVEKQFDVLLTFERIMIM
jgi:hypothetical protein